jgi:hypothetical protein
MKKIRVLGFSGFLCWLSLCSAMQSPLLEKFAQKYAPPEHVVKFIEQNKKRVMSLYSGEWVKARGTAFGYIPECPDVYFKGMNIERLINAERMRTCIKQHQLDLGVAKKYIYNINGTWIVIAEHITCHSHPCCISSNEFKHLYDIAIKTSYWDWNFGSNWLRNEKGLLVCCDTEDISFCAEESTYEWVYHYLHDQMWNNTELFGEGVLSYAGQQKKALMGLKESVTPLHCNTQYDDKELDFDEVKKLLKIEQ